MSAAFEDIKQQYDLLCAGGGDINEHLPTLRRYASECQHITEFGVRFIVSTYAFLVARPLQLISYDITDPAAWGKDVRKLEQQAAACGIDFQFRLQDLCQLCQIAPTDLLFIDTKHNHTQLSFELKQFGNAARKYIIFHDTTTFGYQDEYPDESQDQRHGLKLAIYEFLEDNPHWSLREVFTHNNGLTVLARQYHLAQPQN